MLELGKVYSLADDDFDYAERIFVGRFEKIILIEGEQYHVFSLPDGRKAELHLPYWIVEEGSELLFALG
jgi:hypothetical protein